MAARGGARDYDEASSAALPGGAMRQTINLVTRTGWLEGEEVGDLEVGVGVGEGLAPLGD